MKYILVKLIFLTSYLTANSQCLLNQDFGFYSPTAGLSGSCGGSVDIHNSGGSYWGINEISLDGNPYAGMHPDMGNATFPFEYISFALSSPMTAGNVYNCSFYQAIGELHGLAGFGIWDADLLGNNPGYINIYAGFSSCSTTELIYSSNIVLNESIGWDSETFSYTATSAYTHLTIIPFGLPPGDLAPYMLFDDIQFCEVIALSQNDLNLTAHWSDNDQAYAVLNWQVNNLSLVSRFEIEQSLNGFEWYIIGQKNKVDFSSSESNYEFTYGGNKLIESPRVFYRIKQFNTDGKFSYSSVVKLNCNIKAQNLIWPNPATNQINILIPERKNEKIEIRLVNSFGQLIHSGTYSNEGEFINMSIEEIKEGIYFIIISDEDKSTTLRLIKE